MFHPMVAGVTIPGMGIFVLILAPYIDRNPSNKPEDRKFAIVLFTIFLMFWAVLVIIGSFFRGPGFNFVFPWRAGSSSTCDEAPMSAVTILAIAIPVLVVLALVGVISAARRRDTSDATGALSPRDPQARQAASRRCCPSRRVRAERPRGRAGRRSTLGAAEAVRSCSPRRRPSLRTCRPTPRRSGHPPAVLQPQHRHADGFALAGFGAACSPSCGRGRGGGFGSKITVGKLDDIQASIAQNDGFFYVPEGRMWITAYPADSSPKAEKSGVYAQPVLARHGDRRRRALPEVRAPRLPRAECVTSQWFECPCHGSQYNQVGEKKGGPAPRGLDRFAVAVDGDIVTVDTSTVIQGPPIGTNTTGQEAEGPHCITGGE